MTSLHFISRGRREGRTTLTVGLAALLGSQGKRVTYFKPISTKEDTSPDTDDSFAKQALSSGNGTGVPTPIPATESALASGLGQHATAIRKAHGEVSKNVDVTLVEGLPASDLLSNASVDLADAINSDVVAVIHYSRGLDLNEVTMLKTKFGDRLRGVILNGVPSTSARIARNETVPSLTSRGIDVFGTIPEDRTLLSFAVQDYVDALGGEVLNAKDRTGELVEHVLVGTMVVDASGPYYDRYDNKALVTRTDRPDLQWNAINDRTKCLILTGGGDPIRYVRDKANAFEVPLVVVPKETPDIIDDIASLVTTPQFHYPQKLERAALLIGQHVDLGRLGV